MEDYTKYFQNKKYLYDKGFREYMLKIYYFMALGLLVTGIMAFVTLNYSPLMQLMTGGFGIIIMLTSLVTSVYFFMSINRISIDTAKIMFWLHSAVMGMSLSTLSIIYAGESLAKTFFICSSLFGVMSIYGYITKKDLTSLGTFMIMGLFGLIISTVINAYLQSSAIDFAISSIGIVIFLGLTAWDTQKLKNMYHDTGGGKKAKKVAIMGAFVLYLDFINLFLYLLKFFGDKRK